MNNSYIKTMEEFFMPNNSGKVGIFWYNIKNKELFGIVSESPYIDSNKTNSKLPNGEFAITTNKLHKQICQKEYNKQKIKTGSGPFIGDYKDTPRGRIFYIPNEKKFVICVGDWIKEYDEALDLIIDQFDLWDETYEVNIDSHLDIGSG